MSIVNRGIAELITKSRKDKTPIIHKQELPKLQDLALMNVAENFTLYPDLNGLNTKWKNKVRSDLRSGV